MREKPGFPALVGAVGNLAERRNGVAGAGGIEPPNGGIKIRCLTAWLRPNRPAGERGIAQRDRFRHRRSIEGATAFQQAVGANFTPKSAVHRHASI